MAIREIPAREQRMNTMLAAQGLGSAREFTLAEIAKGRLPKDIVIELHAKTGVSIHFKQLYRWIRRWNKQEQEVAQ